MNSTSSEYEGYDVVVVGAGITGAIVAGELGAAGMRVLVLEAGTSQARTFAGYRVQLSNFYGATFKTPEAPYPFNPNAPQPDIPGIATPGAGYFIEAGPQAYESTYARTAGGTTLHWLGTCLRMLPEDFAIRERFGRGRDWPIGYDDLEPDYERAEWEIGVSADVEDQSYLGISFRSGYQYPMERIPLSWSDRQLAGAVDGMTVTLDGEELQLRVRSTPAGRNSTPRKGYTPVGAVNLSPDWERAEEGQDLARDLGQRCQGNSACVPICPVQAKYNALKTLAKAVRSGNVRVVTQAVASQVLLDEGGRVAGIEFLRYERPDSPRHTVETARGRTYVLACHVVENAKLLLMSGITGPNDLVGANVYDHPTMLLWGLTREPVGAYRGPLSTSGVEDLRGGSFRARHAAFRIEVGNDGWLWPTGAPGTTVTDAVNEGVFGRRLRAAVRKVVGRQVRVGCLIEQLPETRNRVSLAPGARDALGLPRPVIDYSLDDYVLEGMQVAARVTRLIFERAGIEDQTDPAKSFVANATWQGEAFAWGGAGHFAGTHVMGRDASDSVVDSYQRSWTHSNLHVAGPGSMPTMGTSNPTVTVAALAFRTARDIQEHPDGRG